MIQTSSDLRNHCPSGDPTATGDRKRRGTRFVGRWTDTAESKPERRNPRRPITCPFAACAERGRLRLSSTWLKASSGQRSARTAPLVLGNTCPIRSRFILQAIIPVMWRFPFFSNETNVDTSRSWCQAELDRVSEVYWHTGGEDAVVESSLASDLGIIKVAGL